MDETGRKPKVGGLSDPRLGTIDRNFKCQTCGEGMAECPGHFGHIDLARPVFHIGFLGKVKKLLECVCVHCGKVKADVVSTRREQAVAGVTSSVGMASRDRRWAIGPPLTPAARVASVDADRLPSFCSGLRLHVFPFASKHTDLAFATLINATRTNRKRRFQRVWEYASKKMICEADPPKDEDEMSEEPGPQVGHGGCGHPQPLIRKEGLKLFAVWKKGKDDDEEVCVV